MLGIVASTLYQTASWQSKSSVNKYNEATYAAAITIACRKRNKMQFVKDEQGKDVVSRMTILTQTQIQPRDKLDGYVVINIDYWVDIDGTAIGYMVYL